MAVRMQQRRATAEQWLLADPVLAEGEIGLETDTYSFKIGDGVNNWSLLDYFESGASLQATIDDYIPLTQKGVALGVAELDANGFVPASQLDIDVSGDINAAIAALVDSAPAALDTLNELAAALGDDANFATTITTSISSGDAATLASAQSYADQAEIDAVATANAYTDAEIAAIPPVDLTGYATETYADQAEADAKTYTDNLIGDGTVDGTAGNTVTDRIATAVSNLVDAAPDALNTLNELAAALNDDANAYVTLTAAIDAKPDNIGDLGDVTITSAAQNQVIKFNGSAWVNAAAGGGILASDTAPTDTDAYPLWYNTTEGRAYIYYDSFWVELTPSIQGPEGDPGKFTVSDTAPSSPSAGDGWFDSTNARFFVYYDSYWIEAATNYKGAQGGSGFVTQEVSSNVTLLSGYRYFVDTTASRTLTLPAVPAVGDELQIFDATGTAATNNITIENNSKKINGTLDTAVLDVDAAAVAFIYTGDTYGWRLG